MSERTAKPSTGARIRARVSQVTSSNAVPASATAVTSTDEHADVMRRPRQPGLVNNAVYVDGKRVESPGSLQGTFHALDKHPQALAWIGLYRPARETLDRKTSGAP